MEPMEHDQWRERSFEAMETSWKNSSMEDMELDEIGRQSPFGRQQAAVHYPLQHNVAACNFNFASTPMTSTPVNSIPVNVPRDIFRGGSVQLQHKLYSVSDFQNTNPDRNQNHVNFVNDEQQASEMCKNQTSPEKLKSHADKIKQIRSLCEPSPKRQKVQKRHRPKQNLSKDTTKRCCSWSKFFLIPSCLIVLSSVIMHFYIEYQCREFQTFKKDNLRTTLKENLFGQDLAIDTIPGLLDEYFKRLSTNNSTKPLVLSIHGWTGVGKNYVSKIVSEYFAFKTLTKFLVPLNFPHEKDDKLYNKQIVEWVKTNISHCCVNFILFDEMDKSSSGVISGLKTAIIDQWETSHYKTPVIFLLLSNSMGSEINKVVFMSDKPRYQIDVDSELTSVFAVNNAWFSDFVAQELIDNFIPFLPLEKHHVIECIKQDSIKKNLDLSADKLDKILKEMTFVSIRDRLFSSTGCKRVSDKVDLVMYNY
ncbi:torsin-1A [Patella vulgata]|uniref:torsin-1A n=1 Tax=Patella vulgata TaxID=6465 RepID=UPI0021800756|nr:torsin-1A [Patella vulgata]